MAIVNEIASQVPRAIETGFGQTSRHLTFDNALIKISDRLGKSSSVCPCGGYRHR
jgi:hypothetical protein